MNIDQLAKSLDEQAISIPRKLLILKEPESKQDRAGVFREQRPQELTLDTHSYSQALHAVRALKTQSIEGLTPRHCDEIEEMLEAIMSDIACIYDPAYLKSYAANESQLCVTFERTPSGEPVSASYGRHPETRKHTLSFPAGVIRRSVIGSAKANVVTHELSHFYDAWEEGDGFRRYLHSASELFKACFALDLALNPKDGIASCAKEMTECKYAEEMLLNSTVKYREYFANSFEYIYGNGKLPPTLELSPLFAYMKIVRKQAEHKASGLYREAKNNPEEIALAQSLSRRATVAKEISGRLGQLGGVVESPVLRDALVKRLNQAIETVCTPITATMAAKAEQQSALKRFASVFRR